MCDELACRISDCSERTGKLVAQDNSETTVILKELMATNKSLRTDENVQGNLLQNYEHKFPNLPYHLQLTKLCSNVGVTKTVAKGQYCTRGVIVSIAKAHRGSRRVWQRHARSRCFWLGKCCGPLLRLVGRRWF